MRKIYHLNKPLFLIDKEGPEVSAYLHRPDTIFVDEGSPQGIKTVLRELE